MALPQTLQVRIAPLFARRIAAGAPVPSRALTAEELAANLRWFVNPGPRGRPISSLVVSGIPVPALGDVASAIQEARRGALRRVTVHADAADVGSIAGSALAAELDVLAVAVRTAEECEAIGPAPELHLVVPLEPSVLPELGRIAIAAARRAPSRITFTWPFPTGAGDTSAPPAADVAAALAAVDLRGLEWTVKGLPPCVIVGAIPEVVNRVSRSSNRWYVDANHQLERALLFLPDVVRFAKREGCRFCALDPRCDGVAEQWLRTGLVPALVPIRGAGTGAGGPS